MEQGLPIQELANQRLNALVYAYSLFSKNLMEEGVEREKVKRASDNTWAALGVQAGEQMKPILGGMEKMASLQQAGEMARSVHGIEAKVEPAEGEIRTEFLKCPWQEASESLGIPVDWRLCPSGHASFSENLLKTLHPEVSFEFTKSMPQGAPICEERTRL